MQKIDLERIIKEIKLRGLTAYEISKALPLSEAGINKILSGTSGNPRESTLLLLQDYLFKEKDKKDVFLGNSQIIEHDIPSYIVENEEKLMGNQTFRLWLTTKIQEGVIKILGGK